MDIQGANDSKPQSPTDQQPLPVLRRLPLPGTRPVFPSDLKLAPGDHHLPHHRPVTQSDLQISERSFLPGGRPVFKDSRQVSDTRSLPGGRPVFASPSALVPAAAHNRAAAPLPNNRPIAANSDDDDTMGYF
jgi:hypothetical protein